MGLGVTEIAWNILVKNQGRVSLKCFNDLEKHGSVQK